MTSTLKHRRRAQAGIALRHMLVVIATATCAASFASSAGAQAVPAAPPGLPTVPTTRILAIGRLTPKATPQAMPAVMPDEVRETVKLYLGGKIAEWYVRKDGPGVVFILNMTDVAQAHDLLEHLPLGQAGLMAFDLIPIGPLSPLGLLIGPPK